MFNVIVSPSFRSDYPTLLTNVECDHKNFLHILQCKYHFGQTECAHVVNIQCSKSDSKYSINPEIITSIIHLFNKFNERQQSLL